ncbi:MAG: DUF4433 domain-containing protein [Deltaproteobacteria bacterium]|nr:DUF4433 domain-containing protein [Deltaproteobacteria bacterium]
MTRDDVQELHSIMPIANLPSTLENGLLSHARVERLRHLSIAMPDVQRRRALRSVPGGRPLHEYVNLYFHARNPMMFSRKESHTSLCVLRVMHTVLDLPGVAIADQNASTDFARFHPSPEGLTRLDRSLVFAEFWTDPNPIEHRRRKAARCAEVLVPDRVDPCYIQGAYVSGLRAGAALAEIAPLLAVEELPGMFFQ